ncbi:hypothetical protein E2C01_047180 [Portunus trituberculatus]|uniref:Uncharacterized protein n=1 Tax=Portunus trituberculatus TaxID=210409 RepID=A0A5B7FZR1_PORTR|nr:hypothetical protein [Portunus trituberculatus]
MGQVKDVGEVVNKFITGRVDWVRSGYGTQGLGGGRGDTHPAALRSMCPRRASPSLPHPPPSRPASPAPRPPRPASAPLWVVGAGRSGEGRRCGGGKVARGRHRPGSRGVRRAGRGGAGQKRLGVTRSKLVLRIPSTGRQLINKTGQCAASTLMDNKVVFVPGGVRGLRCEAAAAPRGGAPARPSPRPAPLKQKQQNRRRVRGAAGAGRRRPAGQGGGAAGRGSRVLGRQTSRAAADATRQRIKDMTR